MERAGDDFFSNSRFADDQRIGVGGADRPDAVAQVDHCLASPGQPLFYVVAFARNGPQAAVLEHETTPIERAANGAGKHLGGEGLFDEIIGALAHRPDRQLHIAVSGHQDHRQFGIDLADALQKGHSVHSGHADIADDDAVEAEGDAFERMLGAGKRIHPEAGEFQRLSAGATQFLFIVDEQDAGFAHSAASRPVSPATASSIRNTAPPSRWFDTVRLPPKSLMML